MKKKMAGHVKSVKIENFNKEFNAVLYVPFSITTIDMGQKFDTIEFECCGEKKTVKSIYDCNLIGSYDTIWSILNKVLRYGGMMDKHITNKDEGTGMWYAKYIEINPLVGCAVTKDAVGEKGFVSYGYYNGILGSYYSNAFAYNMFSNVKINPISPTIHKKLKNGYTWRKPVYSDTNADCVYGTKQELENWKHFIFNNKLPLFINIVLTINQNNNSKEFLPWLADKQYTDEEINKMFDFTEEEIALIDKTLKKFERHSSWFKRYMCGPADDSTTKSIEADVADIVKGA